MVGTAGLIYPDACIKVCDGIEEYMNRHNMKKMSEITGKIEIYRNR
jgi:hypothetical protein